MYSGFITAKQTVPALGVHQRIDTAAYRALAPYVTPELFPPIKAIIHFEGLNGPDGIKAKSPGKQDPSHLYDPHGGHNQQLIELIETHYAALVGRLKVKDQVRAAYEASWLAHYVCDGLTPAHHFPLDEALSKHQVMKKKRQTRYKHSLIVGGETPLQTIQNSWAVWGGKGLLSTHFNFEMGVAAALVGKRIRVRLNTAQLAEARKIGYIEYFQAHALEVAMLEMYEQFYHRGWTAQLGRQVRRDLIPQITQTIAIIWLLAYLETGQELALEAAA